MLEEADRIALAYNEKPFVLSFYPTGAGKAPALPALLIEDPVVILSAFKRAADGCGYILRLFEPTGTARTTAVSLPTLGIRREIALTPFEVKTFRVDAGAGTFRETSLMEKDL